jgi:hypothetical protein
MADTVDMNATHNSGAVVGQNNGTMVNHFTVPPVDVVSQCITALFVTDARADREGISSTKGSIVEGTCNWVKQHSSYVTWLHSPSDSLWVIGGPGKRKTMLAVYLTQALDTICGDQKLPFACFFCDHRDPSRNSICPVLRTILAQIITQKPDLANFAKSCVGGDQKANERAKRTLSSRRVWRTPDGGGRAILWRPKDQINHGY